MAIDSNNFRDYPLQTLEVIFPIIDELRKIAAEYPGTIVETIDFSDIIRFKADRPGADFYFFITRLADGSVTSGPNDFMIYCNPASETTRYSGTFPVKSAEIVRLFRAWISLILSYDKYLFRLSPEDSIQNAYQKEFIEHFILLDETADSEPFPMDAQIKLIGFLTHIENNLNAIEDKTENVNNILEQTTKLKEEVPTLTKAQTVNRLSKIWAWTRKAGFKVLNKVFDVAIDQAVKSVFDGRALTYIHSALQS
jgi:hypothetical protein